MPVRTLEKRNVSIDLHNTVALGVKFAWTR